MRFIKMFLPLLLLSASCGRSAGSSKLEMKFERTKWDAKDGVNYTYRSQMINDLLDNFNWPGLRKDAVITLLGEPDVVEENIFLLYHYEQNYLGAFVLSTQSLVIQLDNNNIVKLARTN